MSAVDSVESCVRRLPLLQCLPLQRDFSVRALLGTVSQSPGVIGRRRTYASHLIRVAFVP